MASDVRSLPHRSFRLAWQGLLGLVLATAGGCWAPLVSHGIPARTLPDQFRAPIRSSGPPLNFASLTMPPQPDYVLGTNDILEVLVHALYTGSSPVPLRAQIMANGQIHLPMVGAVQVGGMNLLQAQAAITTAYADGFIQDPRVNVSLFQKSSISVLVLGEVNQPGAYALPKYENDVAHAIASAGGLGIDAGMVIEVHRRIRPVERALYAPEEVPGLPPVSPTSHVEQIPSVGRTEMMVAPGMGAEELQDGAVVHGRASNLPICVEPDTQFPHVLDQGPMRIVRIPLRGFPDQPVYTADVVLEAGDVVVVPSRKDEVFFVVGKLSPTNFVRFNIGARERDLGAGFVLPRDRDIDVVTAVAMAGYIDPIDSPTTVTVHRAGIDGQPMLVRVDLIKARYDSRETIMVQAGDIIYLNPDTAWWTRRTIDRIIPSFFSLSYRKLLKLGGTGSDN